MNLPSIAESVLELPLQNRFARQQGQVRGNRREFELGHVYPEAGSSERCVGCSTAHLEFMAYADVEKPTLLMSLHFLHPILRSTGSIELKAGSIESFESLNELIVDGRHFMSGHESIERELKLPPFTPESISAHRASFPFRFYPWREFEPVRDARHQIAGAIVRSQAGIEGVVEVRIEPAATDAFKINVELQNHSRANDAESPDGLLLRTLVSANVVVRASDAELVCVTAHAAD
jgi:hypothetical protein